LFFHSHPYPPFVKFDTKKLIVGTLPPPRFTTGKLLEKDVDFCYGSYHNSLWKYIDHIHKLNLRFDNSTEAIEQRKAYLVEHQIGVCDIVESAKREKIDASDLGMIDIKLRDLIDFIKKYPNVETLLFIGGNSKNGPEYLFRHHLKEYKLKLSIISDEVPRIHQFKLSSKSQIDSDIKRTIQTVSLTSSSGAANISIGSSLLYKQLKRANPQFSTFDYRVMQYKEWL